LTEAGGTQIPREEEDYLLKARQENSTVGPSCGTVIIGHDRCEQADVFRRHSKRDPVLFLVRVGGEEVCC